MTDHTLSGRPRSPKGNGPTHGIASTYRSPFYACRCQPCRDANYALQRVENAKRGERLSKDSSVVEHGLVSTYLNWGCRCDACKAVHAARLREQKEARRARLAADPSVVQHGTVSAYKGWGCRCDECSAAVAAYSRRRYAARKAATK